MKELVNYQKVDIIKELIKEKDESNENKTDYENKVVGDFTIDYFYEYIEPILIDLNNKNILEYDKSQINETTETRRNYLKAISFIREVLNPIEEDDVKYKNDTTGLKNMFRIFKLDKYRQLNDEKGIFFLASNETKLKKEFAQKIKETFEYEYIVSNYSTNYIKPLLLNLGKNQKIKFYEKPKTKEEEFINYSIECVMISIIHQLFNANTPIKEDKTILDLIKNGNDTDKKNLAWTIYFDIFSQQYDDNDLKNIYDMAIDYANNKNKYGLYDFNDYCKIIMSIFNIK